MAGGTGRRRVMLLFTVLAGLFLMHGLSATSMHGTPMQGMPVRGMPMRGSMSQASMPAAVHMVSATSVPMTDAATVSGAVPTADHMQACETCIPLRPEGMSGLFLALFLIVITLWRPGPPQILRLIRPHWPHGPPRTGAQILRTLSISRT